MSDYWIAWTPVFEYSSLIMYDHVLVSFTQLSLYITWVVARVTAHQFAFFKPSEFVVQYMMNQPEQEIKLCPLGWVINIMLIVGHLAVFQSLRSFIAYHPWGKKLYQMTKYCGEFSSHITSPNLKTIHTFLLREDIATVTSSSQFISRNGSPNSFGIAHKIWL